MPMALAVLSVVITPVNELGKYLVRKLKIEFHYVTEYNSHLSKFQKELLQLQEKREDVEKLIGKTKREFKEPSTQMVKWLERVQNLEKDCIPVASNSSTSNKCLKRLQDLFTRRRASKRILKLTKDICEFKRNGSFTVFAHDLRSLDVVPMGPRGTVENIPSRILIMKELMEAFEDDNIRSIGVHGMGGIGKTTLVTRINNELCVNRRFKKVIMVTVSTDPDMKLIQNIIAERLDLKLEEQDMATRAYKLCERLTSEESVLIILDDVWKPVELVEIGLRHSSEHMHCKIILTSRNADVCTRMMVQKIVKMDILSEDESWTLFEAKSSHVVVELPNLEPIAREIVRRCKGSPLAIATLGSALSTETNEFVWAHALRVLQDPNAMGLKDIMPEVVTSLTWSFDHLSNPNVQLCFLYCCLFPEDYSISLSNLRNYGIGERFLRMTTTLEGAWNELLCYVKMLKECCLLLDGDYESSVKMHDVVRDVAILIASDCKDGFLVNIGGGSKYLAESEKLHTYKRISYMRNYETVFPDALECPHLRSLLIGDNVCFMREQNISFEGMKSLVVLKLDDNYDGQIVSVSHLTNLRTLYLDGCNVFNKVYLLRGLTKLEVLSMKRSEIGELPVDIGNLINLKFFDLTCAHIEFVAPNVFSSLSNLEELYMWRSFDGWGTAGDGGRRNAEFIELILLHRLSVLEVYVPDSFLGEVGSHSRWLNNLKHFHLSVGGDFISYNGNNNLKIGKANLLKHGISNFLAISNKNLNLGLRECCGFKSITDLNPAGNFSQLERLWVEACNDVESVIVVNKSAVTPHNSFCILKELCLKKLGRMEKILDGVASSTNVFGKLENLVVEECPKICTILTSNLLFTEKGLENLKQVTVQQCEEVQHVFDTEEDVAPEIEILGATTALLSRITQISLYDLPKLRSIWNGVIPEGSLQSLKSLNVGKCSDLKYLLSFDVARCLQNLEEMHIQHCGAMEMILFSSRKEADATPFFPRCKILRIDSCCKLKSVFPFGVTHHLHQLNEISISHCHGLHQIFGNGEEQRVMEHNSLLPELKYLELRDLKGLTSFYRDNIPISAPLEEVKVFFCPNLITFPLKTVSCLKFIHGEDIWFRRLQSKDERQASMLRPFFQSFFQGMPALAFHGIHEQLHTLIWMVAGLWLDDYASQLEGTAQFRRLLSGTTWYLKLEDVSQSGVVPRFIEFLTRDDHTQLQSEAAWVLADIASRSSGYTKVIIDHGAVPILVRLLGSLDEEIREHAIWALGNVAADSPKYRDLVLGHGALVPLLAQLNDCAKVSILRNALWTISNFFAVKPQPAFEQMKLALPALQRLLHSSNEKVCSDACRALSYLLNGSSDETQSAAEAGVFPQLMELLIHPSSSVLISALRTVGNNVCRDNGQTQCTIEHQVLPCLLNLLTHHDVNIKKDACHIISNITAGNKDQIQSVILYNIIAPLVHLLENAEFDIKKEAAQAISNATCHGTPKQIKHLVKQGCIKPVCDLLLCSDSSIVVVCLQGLINILKVGETGGVGVMNRYVQIIDYFGGFKNIADLQGHENCEVQQKAVNILNSYHMKKYTSSPWDDAEASFQSARSEFKCVESGILSSAERENPASDIAESDKGGTIFLDELIFCGSNGQRKCKQIDLNYPPLSPYLMDGWSNASEEIDLNELRSPPIETAKVLQVDRMPEEIDISSNASVKIDLNCLPTSPSELENESYVNQMPEQERHLIDIWSNVSTKFDPSCLLSLSTELAKDQMPAHERCLIDNSSNASVKNNHEFNFMKWNSSQNEVIGESTCTATTSTHDVWNDQNKNLTLSRRNDRRDSRDLNSQMHEEI